MPAWPSIVYTLDYDTFVSIVSKEAYQDHLNIDVHFKPHQSCLNHDTVLGLCLSLLLLLSLR